MLDSFLNRQKRVIHFNCLIVKDKYDNKLLITDLTQINQAIMLYFQNIVSFTHQPKESSLE